jgi:hypothetical protein
MNQELLMQLLEMKDVYLTSEGKKWIVHILNQSEKETSE